MTFGSLAGKVLWTGRSAPASPSVSPWAQPTLHGASPVWRRERVNLQG